MNFARFFTVSIWGVFLLALSSCQPAPKDISFGEVNCHFCKMTVVDKQHAAQAVSLKGKNFYFDAIECMIDFLNESDQSEWAFLLVSDYSKPAHMAEAEKSTYLISKAIPSPMGAYLSAFEDPETARITQESKGGKLLTWKEIIQNEELSFSF